VVNIGTNRWSFKPEVGHFPGHRSVDVEFQAAGTFFTDNRDFFGGSTRVAGSHLLAAGACHLRFTESGVWGSLDVTYFTGGRTTLNGVRKDDLQQNWRVGGTLAFPRGHATTRSSCTPAVAYRHVPTTITT
jgi:hypothetical protein